MTTSVTLNNAIKIMWNALRVFKEIDLGLGGDQVSVIKIH